LIFDKRTKLAFFHDSSRDFMSHLFFVLKFIYEKALKKDVREVTDYAKSLADFLDTNMY
jgi:hypothetical protein